MVNSKYLKVSLKAAGWPQWHISAAMRWLKKNNGCKARAALRRLYAGKIKL